MRTLITLLLILGSLGEVGTESGIGDIRNLEDSYESDILLPLYLSDPISVLEKRLSELEKKQAEDRKMLMWIMENNYEMTNNAMEDVKEMLLAPVGTPIRKKEQKSWLEMYQNK